MGHRQAHRGAHPEDANLFARPQHGRLRNATADLSWHFTRGYAAKAALKLVGDHYQLATRQRRAVLAGACSGQSLARRLSHQIAPEQARGEWLYADGFNILIQAESMLGNGVLLRGRDGVIRDMASVHGSYRKVAETEGAISLLGEVLESLAPGRVVWHFDAPVSNSGRLRRQVEAAAQGNTWPWEAYCSSGVDRLIASNPGIAVTSDGWILDHACRWLHLGDLLAARSGRLRDVISLA